MKLIYLSHWRYPAEKTHAQFAMKTCEAFASKGIEVEMWVPTRENHLTEDAFSYHDVEENFKIVQIPCIDIMHINDKVGFQLMVLSYAKNIVKKAKKEKASIFYAHDARDLYFLAGKVKPIYLEVHDFYESKYKFITKKVFEHISGFVVTNSIKVKRIHESYGIDKSRLLMQPNAVDICKFDIEVSKKAARDKVGLPHDEKIVLYIGTLYGWKGVHTLADASKDIKGVVCFVGGPEREQEQLKDFVKAKGYANVHFIDRQPHELMPHFIKSADVVVLPNTAKDNASKYETSPVKLFEYLASKTPIVASDIPSIRDIVSDEHVQFATPDDPMSFADAINNILSSGEEAHKRSEAGFSHAQKFTWDKRADLIQDFIERTNSHN